MAFTPLQRTVCQLIAAHRIASGESYVAGGVALNALLGASRLSRDIDVFHDADEAVEASWTADRRLLESHGFRVAVLRARQAYVEAEVERDGEHVVVEWARDSAFRFFPLVTHPELGMTLHPVDAATNKVLALVGRVEARDWVDVVACSERIQQLGFLAWAASGKDPGFSPAAILDIAARTARYSRAEVEALAFAGPPPDAAALSAAWHAALARGREIVALLPPERTGACVLTPAGELFPDDVAALTDALARGALLFHEGRLRGAFPVVGGARA